MPHTRRGCTKARYEAAHSAASRLARGSFYKAGGDVASIRLRLCRLLLLFCHNSIPTYVRLSCPFTYPDKRRHPSVDMDKSLACSRSAPLQSRASCGPSLPLLSRNRLPHDQKREPKQAPKKINNCEYSKCAKICMHRRPAARCSARHLVAGERRARGGGLAGAKSVGAADRLDFDVTAMSRLGGVVVVF